MVWSCMDERENTGRRPRRPCAQGTEEAMIRRQLITEDNKDRKKWGIVCGHCNILLNICTINKVNLNIFVIVCKPLLRRQQ